MKVERDRRLLSEEQKNQEKIKEEAIQRESEGL
jgi:hypothetical protein